MEKRKVPKFYRRDWYKVLRIGKKSKKKRVWRASKGIHSKTRLKVKGKPKSPTVGYGEAKKLFGLIKGVQPVFIENIKKLNEIGKNEGIIISGKLGKRKRNAILEEAKKKNLKVLNNYFGGQHESKQ
jgi:large subunit ribosomal protein L32e